MLILYTGGNTSFNGFPFLTSYVAGDSFLRVCGDPTHRMFGETKDPVPRRRAP